VLVTCVQDSGEHHEFSVEIVCITIHLGRFYPNFILTKMPKILQNSWHMTMTGQLKSANLDIHSIQQTQNLFTFSSPIEVIGI
jgi:hypothetical protein